MARIDLMDTQMNAIVKMADGNPGAAIALVEILATNCDPDSFLGSFGCILGLDTAEIYGSEIYVLFNDVCERKPVLVHAVMRSVQLGLFPVTELKRALSSRYDCAKAVNPESLYLKVKEQLPNFNN